MIHMNIIMVILGVSLGIFAVLDIKYQEISVLPVLVLGVVISGVRLWNGTGVAELLLGLIPGVFLLLASFFTRGSVGVGDGLVLLVLGIGCGFERTVFMFWTALFAGGVYAAILLLSKKAGRKTLFPFLPFLFLGYTLGVLWK